MRPTTALSVASRQSIPDRRSLWDSGHHAASGGNWQWGHHHPHHSFRPSKYCQNATEHRV